MPARCRNKPPLKLNVTALAGRSYARSVSVQLNRAAAMVGGKLQELTIVFVGDRRMSELHGRYMNLPTPTDVLTFPIDEDARQRPLTGEVYVCIPEARRQAKLRGTAVTHEVLLYSLHGMLHLSGFDDRTERDYRKMHRMEDRILVRLGIGRVFDSPARQAELPTSRAVRRRHQRTPLATRSVRGVIE